MAWTTSAYVAIQGECLRRASGDRPPPDGGAFVQTVVALNAAHINWIRASLFGVVVGILLVVAGNYLGQIRSNFFFSTRTPWTLSSELSWNKTHCLGGRVFVVRGLLLAVASLTSNAVLNASAAVAIALGTAARVVYSYVVWSGDASKTAIGRHEALPREQWRLCEPPQWAGGRNPLRWAGLGVR